MAVAAVAVNAVEANRTFIGCAISIVAAEGSTVVGRTVALRVIIRAPSPINAKRARRVRVAATAAGSIAVRGAEVVAQRTLLTRR